MNKAQIIHHFRLHKEDNASISIEIGLLSERICKLEGFISDLRDTDPSFLLYRLRLIQLVDSRRKLLNLLLSTNIKMHDQVVGVIRHVGFDVVSWRK